MTILDEVYNFSDEQDIAASTLSSGTTIASTDVIDQGSDMTDAFGTAIYDAAIGSQAKAPVVVLTVGNETFAGASAAVIAKIQSKASSASISSGGTEHARVTFSALSAQDTQKTLPVPVSGMNRYWGITYTASGGNLTAGYMNAYLADAAEKHD